jgi:putative ABC transport system ATP-binding protein
VIADEPTGELDAATAREVLALIAGLVRESGSTALVVSHDPASAEHADRVIHVRDGRISDERAGGGSGDGAIVVGRGGWLRLPEDVLRSAGIDRHATAELRGREVVLQPSGESVTVSQAPQPAPGAAPGVRVTGSQAPIVEARGLTKRFGSAMPLERLDASFAPGRLTVVTGPSGSGKTTLLLLLAGLELPDEGEVLLEGVSLASLDRAGRAEVRRTTLAFVGQTAGLTPFLGARENVELALELRGLPADHAAAALEAVGLAEHAERPVAKLSAGQRERAALARALAVQPRVIVADEPTARLDAANALALGTLLAEVARTSGCTVVCATHDPLLIEQADAELSLGSR